VQERAPAVMTRKLRGRYFLAGAMMLLLWSASIAALVQDSSRFNITAAIVTALTFLPLGLVALRGGITGTDTAMLQARNALFVCGGLLLLVVTVEVCRRIFFLGN